MRIVSYNILDGGEGRADPIAETLLAQKPDIVVLVEADNIDVLERISRRLEMDYVRGEGSSHAVAIFSRWVIDHSINHAAIRGQPRCLLEAAIQQPDGPLWVVGAVHLPAGAREDDERQRETQLPALLEAFADHRRAGRPHILCGDLNSNSPIQDINPACVKEKTRQAYLDNGGRIPRRVMQALFDAGYVDTLALVDPQAAAHAGSFTTQTPGQRVDYILAWGFRPRQVSGAWIEQDRLARYASDHFPVGAQISAA